MNDFMKAMEIFMKYVTDHDCGGFHYPFHCERDTLYFCAVSPDVVSGEDKKILDDLGFFVSEHGDCFMSFRFGSC